jgi:hypothetical protein
LFKVESVSDAVISVLGYLQSLQYQTPLIRLPSFEALLQIAQIGTKKVNSGGVFALAELVVMA